MRPQTRFTRAARWTARMAGRPAAFILAAGVILVWAITGPLFQFNETWQLTINTLTTIVTFLMVFLIQTTQNRDTEAIHVKLDELIRATRGAHQSLLDLEELEEQDLALIRAKYAELAAVARRDLRRGVSDTEVPEVQPMDGLTPSEGTPVPRAGRKASSR